MRPSRYLLLFVAVIVAGLSACATPSPPSPAALPAEWSEFVLPGKRRTHYTRVDDAGIVAIRADADASASMLRRALRIEPAALGRVEFSWRVAMLIDGADLSDREASDSPARVVLAFDGEASRLSSRNRAIFDLAEALTGEAPPYATLMYVWDNRVAPETVITSGRTDRVRKIVVDSGRAALGQWRHHVRDIVADYRRAFGEDPGALIGVGLMTDADNTRARASALYGELRLIAADGRRL